MSRLVPSREEVIQRILDERLIAVVRATDSTEAIEVGQALADAGIHLIEITFTVRDAATAIRRLGEALPDAIVGAGSVTEPAQVEEAIAAGARFLVSPIGYLDMIPICHRHGVISMAAGLTPSELAQAWRAGSDFVKLFPAGSLGGPSYVRSVLAPLPELPLIPTGGVTLDNLEAYLRAGAKAIGLGSALMPKPMVEAKDWEGLRRHAEHFVRAVTATEV
ncbi:MAG: bifunctional 4-hydroxy-2-oxoglutarate aldolase/2-dehydro-3-deoxy-phosphogluconate aldolase [Anaerolineae bacterium]|nr:bifunctional 4-hydroxy-2-oxoglutarate aldolase/2-dehydro-3-deoxy-phosphogluconate aldolase [Anaerolineae bacterium]